MKVAVEPRFIHHPKYPFLGGHLDRRIVGKRAFLECKTTNAYDNRMWGEEEMGHEGVPAHYLAQCDHYMMCDDSEYCWIAVLIGGSGFRKYRIERSPVREKKLLAAELQFWDMVQRNILPPIESEADAKHRWESVREGTSVPIDLATRSKIIALSIVQARRKLAADEEKKLRDEIFPLFQDAQSLSYNGERVAELTAFFRTGFDSEAFEKKHPKIAAKFMRKLPTKRLKLRV